MKSHIILALASFAAAESVADDYEAWESAPLGISITRCDYSTRGVFVRFETDLKPPYYVGIYRPSEESLGRRTPVAEIETSIKEAFIHGDYTPVTLIVQVMTKDVIDRYADDDVGRRVLSDGEVDCYMSSIRCAAPYVDTDAASYSIDGRKMMELTGDHTWVGFAKTSETNLTLRLHGVKYEPGERPDDDFRPVTVDYSLYLRDGRADVGTGYRIIMFERSGVCQAQRAYSARTNMSDTVVLPAGFRALSSHNGYIYTTDWTGRRCFQRVTNGVDHVFGGWIR